MEKHTDTYLFAINNRSIIEGEKNKVIKIFLNQLDLKVKDEQIKIELRQIFLDVINGFARLSNGLLKNNANSADYFNRLESGIQEIRNCLDQ